MGEITIEEILERGIKLPEGRLSFPADEFDNNKDTLKGVGGIYTFTHSTEGWLYVGVSADLRERLSKHTAKNGANHSRKNNFLNWKLNTLENIVITVIKESDVGLREFYENYLILKHTPKGNTQKTRALTNGYSVRLNDKKKQELVKLCGEGYTYREIENKTGIKVCTIGKTIRELKVIPKTRANKLTKEQIQVRNKDIIKCFSEHNMSYSEISARFDVTRTTVCRVVKNSPNVVAPKVQIEYRNAKILEMHTQEGTSYKDLAEHFGVSIDTVYNVFRKQEVSK